MERIWEQTSASLLCLKDASLPEVFTQVPLLHNTHVYTSQNCLVNICEPQGWDQGELHKVASLG